MEQSLGVFAQDPVIALKMTQKEQLGEVGAVGSPQSAAHCETQGAPASS
jgi:hypothetical protein